MKVVRYCFVIILFFTAVSAYNSVNAQCAMCSLNAENSVKDGNTEGNGLNTAILYLLAAPYIAIATVGFIWYKKYRRKNVVIDLRDEKINLN